MKNLRSYFYAILRMGFRLTYLVVPLMGFGPRSFAAVNPILSVTQFNFGEVVSAKFNTLLQGWSIQNQNVTPNDQSFRLRRAELKLSGVIANSPRYFFMADPARLIAAPNSKPIAAENMIQDFGITQSLVLNLDITVGQFKTPTTAEGLDSAGDLPLPERSLIGRTLGDRREMGVKVGYWRNFGSKVTAAPNSDVSKFWSVTSMLSSGRAISSAGQGMFHDLDSRIEISPLRGLVLGGFVVAGDDFSYSKKGRWGVNARQNLGGAVLRIEYGQMKDRALQNRGITTEAGYWINENFEPVVRYETFGSNQLNSFTGKAETVGMNYYFRKHFTKLQVSGSSLQNMAAVNGSTATVKGVNNHEATFAVQVAI